MNDDISLGYINKDVKFVERSQHHERIKSNAYEFTARGKFKSIKKWMFRKLIKWNCMDFYVEEKYFEKINIISPQNLIHGIIKQKESIFRHYHRDGQTLLIGSKEYAEIMQMPEIRCLVDFSCPVNMNARIMNLNVKIIPWMSGMITVP